MIEQIQRFLDTVDEALVAYAAEGERLDWYAIGRSALILHRPQDRADLQFLCDTGRLQVDKLKESLGAAFVWSMEKDADPNRERAYANVERVILYLQGKANTL